MTLIRALMVAAIADAALATQNAEACPDAAPGSDARCAPPAEAPEAQLDIAKKNGRSSAQVVSS